VTVAFVTTSGDRDRGICHHQRDMDVRFVPTRGVSPRLACREETQARSFL
jgi:hypothetical protein